MVFLPADGVAEDTAALRQLGVESWHAPFAASVASDARAHGHRFDVVLLSRHYVAAELLPLVRRFAPQARIVFDTASTWHFLRENVARKWPATTTAAAPRGRAIANWR